MKEKNQQIKALRKQGLTYEEIGKKFDLSRQRIHQILNLKDNPSLVNGIKLKTEKLLSRKKIISILKKKISENQKKRPVKQYLYNIAQTTGLTVGSRDRFREIIRLRDNHTCQWCGRKWKEGERKFDVCNIFGDNNHAKSVNNNSKVQITLCHQCNLTLSFKKHAKRKI